MNALVVVRGETGRSKSESLHEWCRQNNHGRSIYVECEERMSYHRFLSLIARSVSLSSQHSVNGFRAGLSRHLGRRHTLVIDEAGHLFNPRRPDTAGFDFIRSIHDHQHVGVVLCFTQHYWDSLAHGRLSGFFEQFIGRVSYHVAIKPGVVYQEEVDAVCRAFVPEPDHAFLRIASEIAKANDGKLRALFRDLANAAKYAKSVGEELAAKHLRHAREWRESAGEWSELTEA
jgi:DNA transposition AAA+ family ATPase